VDYFCLLFNYLSGERLLRYSNKIASVVSTAALLTLSRNISSELELESESVVTVGIKRRKPVLTYASFVLGGMNLRKHPNN